MTALFSTNNSRDKVIYILNFNIIKINANTGNIFGLTAKIIL